MVGGKIEKMIYYGERRLLCKNMQHACMVLGCGSIRVKVEGNIWRIPKIIGSVSL